MNKFRLTRINVRRALDKADKDRCDLITLPKESLRELLVFAETQTLEGKEDFLDYNPYAEQDIVDMPQGAEFWK
jgi:hypothetical protein